MFRSTTNERRPSSGGSSFTASLVGDGVGFLSLRTTKDLPPPFPELPPSRSFSPSPTGMEPSLIRRIFRNLFQSVRFGGSASIDESSVVSTLMTGGGRVTSSVWKIAAALPSCELKNVDASSMMAVCDRVRTCTRGCAEAIAPGGSPLPPTAC